MATVTLRPVANGTYNNWSPTGAASNYLCVQESSSDGDTTYISGGTNSTNSFTIGTNTIGASDTINSVTVYLVSRCTSTSRGASAFTKTFIRENSTDTEGTQYAPTTSYATYSTTYNTRPSGGAWTKTDIDNLEIGCSTGVVNLSSPYVTQVYVIVDYTPNAAGGSLTGLNGITGIQSITL